MTAISENFVLSPEQIEQLEPAARRGDAKAAEALSLYFGYICLDLERQLYWARFAAEYGDEIDRENLETIEETMCELKQEEAAHKREEKEIKGNVRQ